MRNKKKKLKLKVDWKFFGVHISFLVLGMLFVLVSFSFAFVHTYISPYEKETIEVALSMLKFSSIFFFIYLFIVIFGASNWYLEEI